MFWQQKIILKNTAHTALNDKLSSLNFSIDNNSELYTFCREISKACFYSEDDLCSSFSLEHISPEKENHLNSIFLLRASV